MSWPSDPNAPINIAKKKFDDECADKGWKITYTDAYRPQIVQAHFYEIYIGKISNDGHGNLYEVAYPRATDDHNTGKAFDALVTDKNGNSLNGKNLSILN